MARDCKLNIPQTGSCHPVGPCPGHLSSEGVSCSSSFSALTSTCRWWWDLCQILEGWGGWRVWIRAAPWILHVALWLLIAFDVKADGLEEPQTSWQCSSAVLWTVLPTPFPAIPGRCGQCYSSNPWGAHWRSPAALPALALWEAAQCDSLWNWSQGCCPCGGFSVELPRDRIRDESCRLWGMSAAVWALSSEWEASIPLILCCRVIMALCMEGVPAVLSLIQSDTLSFWCRIIRMLPALFTPSPKKRAGAWLFS